MASTPSSKPFGIQSPEQIAKDYGGNKQKIAEAMQLGIVDPTIGTLAGMFIDRMAAGAAQGQAPQSTVAAQVFNPQTPPAQAPGGAGPGAPPMGPPPPDMGMGAPPMSMGPPPPDMGMGAPPPDMPMPPPSPEAMQPMGPGMADGGMVAFRRGGSSDDYRLPPMREERHNNLLELVRQFTGEGIDRRVGGTDIHAGYSPLMHRSEYGADIPLNERTKFFVGARNKNGFVPDEFRVGLKHKFADGGMVAFARSRRHADFVHQERGRGWPARWRDLRDRRTCDGSAGPVGSHAEELHRDGDSSASSSDGEHGGVQLDGTVGLDQRELHRHPRCLLGLDHAAVQHAHCAGQSDHLLRRWRHRQWLQLGSDRLLRHRRLLRVAAQLSMQLAAPQGSGGR